MDQLSFPEEMFNRRESIIPFPDTHTKVLLLGPTGVGKTTLLKKILGVTSKTSSFLADSNSRTTLANTEIITTDFNTPFSAVVTFFEEKYVSDIINMAIIDALDAFDKGKSYDKVCQALYNGTKSEFNLKLILGNFIKIQNNSTHKNDIASIVLRTLEDFDNCLGICFKDFKEINESIETGGYKNLTAEDRTVFEALRNEALFKKQSFKNVYSCIRKVMLNVIDNVTKHGKLEKNAEKWPVCFQYISKERDFFIKTLESFTGNAAKLQGALATPLVEGVRISGPFSYNGMTIPKLAIMDGKGVGHDNSGSVPISVRRSFTLVDNITVITTDAHDTRYATQLTIEAVLTDGFSDNLSVIFTKLDSITGANIEDFDDKKSKVQESYKLVLDGIKDTLGIESYDTLENMDDERYHYLSDLDQETMPTDSQKAVEGYIESLTCKKFKRNLSLQQPVTKKPTPPPSVVPSKKKNIPTAPVTPTKEVKSNTNSEHAKKHFFSKEDFESALTKEIENFRNKWRIILRLDIKLYQGRETVKAEHWTRIRALTRYVGLLNREGYDNLAPAADMRRILGSIISSRTTNKALRQECACYLNEQCLKAVNRNQLNTWLSAYNHSGTGSTKLRASEVYTILKEATCPSMHKKIITELLKISSKYS